MRLATCWPSPKGIPMVFNPLQMDATETLGDGLRAARNRLGCSVESVSMMSGVDAVSLERYEAGLREPTGSTLEVLAEVYGVSVEDLRTNTVAG